MTEEDMIKWRSLDEMARWEVDDTPPGPAVRHFFLPLQSSTTCNDRLCWWSFSMRVAKIFLSGLDRLMGGSRNKLRRLERVA